MISAACTAVVIQQVLRDSHKPIFLCRLSCYSTGYDKSCWVEVCFGCIAVLQALKAVGSPVTILWNLALW